MTCINHEPADCKHCFLSVQFAVLFYGFAHLRFLLGCTFVRDKESECVSEG